jgi:hypothetical protein
MPWRYSKHYTRDEARRLLPQIREWLAELLECRDQLKKFDEQIGELLGKGYDLGGQLVSTWLKLLLRLRQVLSEFQKREIEIKDVDRGLVDFPAFIGGKEVFLCWEKDEEDIEFWHDLETGYSGREPIE